ARVPDHRAAVAGYQLPASDFRLPASSYRLPPTAYRPEYTRSVLTRFAPAPTGWLHLGHVLNAEYVWGSEAAVILRIEDHDRERLCNWTYQFAASVDDFRQGIDLVIRGEDLLPSTGRQIRIARLLGRARPAAFHHHPLLMKSATQKLSKSDGDTGIRDLRARGWTPEQVKASLVQ